MSPDECADKVRFTLSDETGALRFKDFDIIDAPECKEIADTLRQYLLGRPVAEIDVGYIRTLECPGNGQCMHAIANVVAQNKAMFGSLGR